MDIHVKMRSKHLLSEAEKNIMEVAQRKNAGAFHNIKDVLVRTYDNIELMHNRVGDITGIATGFAELRSNDSRFPAK